ncbi:MAG: X-Pro dipeptidyl-peptidase [Planctomycetes bacterium]|nr:X-Pro dipeptidyl-peptidase [Planctomycetota bacterium]
MRDGVKLYTQIFEPVGRDASSPILLTRTPYDVGAMPRRVDPSRLGPSPLFADAGYVFVSQDVRGRFRSEGDWKTLRPPRLDPTDPSAVDETTDASDTIDWLLEHVPGHNGRVGMWGISYDAWQTVMAMVDAHPALVAVSPQASPADMYVGDDIHHNGAFRLSYTFAWHAFMAARGGNADPALIRPALQADAYEFFLAFSSLQELEQRFFQGRVPDWDDLIVHADYDEYWQRRNVLHLLDDVRPAVLHVAGWFDAEDFRGPIDLYHRVESSDDQDRNYLVVGPWKHGGWNVQTGETGESLGDLDFGSATSETYRDQVELPFFEHWLRDDADPLLPEVMAFETGGNTWHELDQWPPESIARRPLYLRVDGAASFEAPGAGEGHSEFLSDPSDPVPYTADGPVFPKPDYMVEDQRFLEGRADVLSFVPEPLAEDLVIAGRIGVRLHFSTTGTDADWIVKLIDVHPEDSEELSPATGRPLAGARMILSGEVFRARYRDSFEDPSPLEPGRVTELDFVLPDRMHRFRAGHRIMVQVHSTWFPLYDRNPQTYTDIYRVNAADLESATHRVFHRDDAASRLSLPVFPR